MNSNIEFLDIINILSFTIGLMNYQETLTQTDKQDLMREVDNKTSKVLHEIEEHLRKQDLLLQDIRRYCDDKNQDVSGTD